jgi:hypothetical protein
MTSNRRVVMIDTTPSAETTSYKRLGKGITTFTPSNGGKIEQKQYINQVYANTTRNGMQKQWAFSGDKITDDDAITFVLSLSEKIGDDAKTTIVIYDLKDGEDEPVAATAYTAKRYNVVVDVTNDGSLEGGNDAGIDGTIYVNGDPTVGTFTPGTSTFAEVAA